MRFLSPIVLAKHSPARIMPTGCPMAGSLGLGRRIFEYYVGSTFPSEFARNFTGMTRRTQDRYDSTLRWNSAKYAYNDRSPGGSRK